MTSDDRLFTNLKKAREIIKEWRIEPTALEPLLTPLRAVARLLVVITAAASWCDKPRFVNQLDAR